MNYLFRPTPVVVLGRDRGVDGVQLVKPPAGIMAGSPHSSGRPSRSLATQGAPWLVRSGTMASFGTVGQSPLGILGQDDTGADVGSDGSSGFDFSGAFNPPTPPPPDFSGAFSPPILPTSGGFSSPPPVAPDLGPSIPLVTSSIPIQFGTPPPSPTPPSAGAGATGQSIPGTQPINPVQASAAASSFLNSIANIFKPSSPQSVPGYGTLPGYGFNPRQAGVSNPYGATSTGSLASFWNSATILPPTPNSTVLLGGVAVLILFSVLLGSRGKK